MIRRPCRSHSPPDSAEMPFDTLSEPFEVLDPGAGRMEKFIIEGGQPLSGTIIPAGNKNAALPALAATLLTEEEVVLRNVPRIRDVEAMIDLLLGLGATAEWREENVVVLCAADVTSTEVQDAQWRSSSSKAVSRCPGRSSRRATRTPRCPRSRPRS